MALSRFTVRSGSTALSVGGVHHGYARIRDELMTKGILVPRTDEPNILEFMEDVSFNSSSAAASVVLGRNASGPLEWKQKGTQQKLREWEADQNSAPRPQSADGTAALATQISRDDLLEAIAALDRGEPHSFGPSTFYDVLENGRRYPPKGVVGLAARRVLGRSLKPNEFDGGEDTWAFRLLRERGFTIVEKTRTRGTFALPDTPTDRVWIEDTKTAAHGHGGPGWEFGSCLWSPSTNRQGVDQYASMREPQIDDLVIHINDGDFAGWSYISAPYRELTEGPPTPGEWAGRHSYYQIDLKSYREFPRSVSLRAFIAQNRLALEDEIKKDHPKRYPFILYREGDVRHGQGMYLARCTPQLYKLIRSAAFGDDTVGDVPAPPTSPLLEPYSIDHGRRLSRSGGDDPQRHRVA